jgi:MYXO-CTERM domain-containing protein
MVGTKGGIKEMAGAYGALMLVALGLALRRRNVR